MPATLAAVALVLGAIVALIFAGSLMARCSMPAESPPNDAMEQPNGTQSTAQTTATASQVVKVTITRKPTSQDAPQATKQDRPGGLSLNGTDSGSTAPTDGESIVIEVSQAVGVTAGASASAFVGNDGGNVRNEHARLGVIAATMPGVFAMDYQAASLTLPPWLLGTHLELGLDAAVNLEAGALGVTAGGKAFAGAYYWSRWNLSDHGPALAVGLRF